MALGKQSAPSAGSKGPLESDANPEGKPDVSTGKQGPDHVIDGEEHVLGDDPRRVPLADREGGYHDALTGRAVTAEGEFTEPEMSGQGPVPKHRIVADNWPQDRERIDDPTKRPGNEA